MQIESEHEICDVSAVEVALASAPKMKSTVEVATGVEEANENCDGSTN